MGAPASELPAAMKSCLGVTFDTEKCAVMDVLDGGGQAVLCKGDRPFFAEWAKVGGKWAAELDYGTGDPGNGGWEEDGSGNGICTVPIPSWTCPNGIPNFVTITASDWFEWDGGSYAIKDGVVGYREWASGRWQYEFRKDGVIITGQATSAGVCEGPVEWPSPPKVPGQDMPEAMKSCLGVTFDPEKCAVGDLFDGGGQGVYCKGDRPSITMWGKVNERWYGQVYYGDGDSGNGEWQEDGTANGACTVPSWTCANGIPNFVTITASDWFEWEGGSYAVKDGVFGVRWTSGGSYEYEFVKDGTEISGYQATGQCEGPKSWPSPAAVAGSSLPANMKSCLGVTFDSAKCAVVDIYGDGGQDVFCKGERPFNVWWNREYEPGKLHGRVYYGDRDSGNADWEEDGTADGYCTAPKACTNGIPTIASVFTDADWQPAEWFWFDFAIKDRTGCFRRRIGDLTEYTCYKDGEIAEAEGWKSTGKCKGDTAFSGVTPPVLLAPEHAACLGDIVKDANCFIDNPGSAQCINSALKVDYSAASGRAEHLTIGGRLVSRKTAGGTCQIYPSPAPVAPSGGIPWVNDLGIKSWDKIGLVEGGASNGIVCMKWKDQHVCWNNSQECEALNQPSGFYYDSCEDGWNRDRLFKIFPDSAQEADLIDMIDPKRCAVAYVDPYGLAFSVCVINGRFTSITAMTDGSAVINTFGPNGDEIGSITRSASGGIETDGVQPTDSASPGGSFSPSPQDQTSGRSGLTAGQIAAIAVPIAVVVLAAIGITIAYFYLKYNKQDVVENELADQGNDAQQEETNP
jgi:hypothetical protein